MGIGVSRFTGKLGSRRAAWHGACESPQKNKKRAEGRRSLAAGQPFYFYTRSPVSFLAVFYPRSPFSPAFARNKFINKRAGDPRPLQGAPAEIERVENNRARRDANQPRETIFRSSPPVPSESFPRFIHRPLDDRRDRNLYARISYKPIGPPLFFINKAYKTGS